MDVGAEKWAKVIRAANIKVSNANPSSFDQVIHPEGTSDSRNRITEYLVLGEAPGWHIGSDE
jgi:hypothetical protein